MITFEMPHTIAWLTEPTTFLLFGKDQERSMYYKCIIQSANVITTKGETRSV